MKTYHIRPLDNGAEIRAAAVQLLAANCPSESDRYAANRLSEELHCVEALPFYRRFWGAYTPDNQLLAVGGIKAADWASDTHILYMMAVEQIHRGQGVGTALEKARLDWLRDNFANGRCLVSTRHKKRFMRWGFSVASEISGRYLMILEF